ncbi:c-type cytochrome [Pseudomonas sp. NW5]|uniref:c-type cytochrome n=1 Tax=Pseudomonas sp. NW5 TaxID=2934934 RepID=UPI00201FDF42|nr:c-type cytochrome [Pseudomonas sp. NW5]MCL7461348.1 c-type cytochrome [Pseudomonas sp. NW5]
MKKLLIAASLVAMTASVQAAQDPEAVYNKACLACHAAGVAGAPKKGDAAAWAPRLAKGTDALLASVKNGLNAMPAGGLCMDCSDEDYKAVIEWMSK